MDSMNGPLCISLFARFHIQLHAATVTPRYNEPKGKRNPSLTDMKPLGPEKNLKQMRKMMMEKGPIDVSYILAPV